MGLPEVKPLLPDKEGGVFSLDEGRPFLKRGCTVFITKMVHGGGAGA